MAPSRYVTSLVVIICTFSAVVRSNDDASMTLPHMLTKETVDWSNKYLDLSAHKPREPQTWSLQHQIEQAAREQRISSAEDSVKPDDVNMVGVRAPSPADRPRPQENSAASVPVRMQGGPGLDSMDATQNPKKAFVMQPEVAVLPSKTKTQVQGGEEVEAQAETDATERSTGVAVQPEIAVLPPKVAQSAYASTLTGHALPAMEDNEKAGDRNDYIAYARDVSIDDLKAAKEAEEHEVVHHYMLEDDITTKQGVFTDELDENFSIYIYDLPARFNKQSAEYHVGSRPMQDDIAGLEAQVYDLFTRRYSPIITTDISKAKAYLVPVLAANMCVDQSGDEKTCIRKAYLDAIEEVKLQGMWNSGYNHFFIAMWDLGICGSQCTYVGEQGDAKDCSDWIQQRGITSNSLIEEAGQILFYNAVDTPACFRDDRDVVLPAFKSLPEPAHRPEVATNKLYFRGLASSPVRLELAQEFRGVDGAKVLVNEPASAPQVAMEMAMSDFCLLPRGAVPWSYHLLEVARAGCIPVIPDVDTVALPAHRSINWSKAAVLVNGHTKQAIENAVWDKSDQDVRRYRAYCNMIGRELGSWESDKMFSVLMHEISTAIKANAVSRSRTQQLLQPETEKGSAGQLTVLHA